MFIDSPQFPKRKVVYDNSRPAGGFGYERMQLANFVADQLNNNHRDDAAILEKFRKEAEQYKRNLLHRKHQQPDIQTQRSLPEQQFSHSHKRKPQSYDNRAPPSPDIKLNEPQQQHTIQPKFQYSLQPSRQIVSQSQSPVVVREIVRMPDNSGNSGLVKLIQRKDKQLDKQAKIIRRNQEKISDLRRRLQILEQDRRIKQQNRIAALQQNTYEKLKGYISSMSNRLIENQAILQQNLSDITYNKKKSLSQTQQIPQNLSTIASPKPLKKARTNPHIVVDQFPDYDYDYEHERNPEPQVTYSHNVVTERQMELKKSGLHSVLEKLGTSRNRLDALGSYV